MAHNLARWTARIGLGEQVVTTRDPQTALLRLVGRLTRSARRLTLHLRRAGPGGTCSVEPWRDCAPCHPLSDGGAGKRYAKPRPHQPADPGSPQLAPDGPATVPYRLRTLPWVLPTPAGGLPADCQRPHLPEIRPARRAPFHSVPLQHCHNMLRWIRVKWYVPRVQSALEK